MHPKEFFATQKLEPEAGRCFVIMPFEDGLQKVYNVVRKAIEDGLHFSCERADDVRGAGYVMDSVLRSIGESEFIIADITNSNPNVFYELGIAHMVKDANKVVILRQNRVPVPFDIGPYRYIDYEISGAKQLRDNLLQAIKETADVLILQTTPHTVYQFKLRKKMSYNFPRRLKGQDHCSYGFTLFGDDVGDDIVKLTFKFTRYVAGSPPAALPSTGDALVPRKSLRMPYIPWYLEIEQLSGSVATLNLVKKPRHRNRR